MFDYICTFCASYFFNFYFYTLCCFSLFLFFFFQILILIKSSISNYYLLLFFLLLFLLFLLQVRITRQLADALHNYFSIDAVSNNENTEQQAATAMKEKQNESSSPPISIEKSDLSTRKRVLNYLNYNPKISEKGVSERSGGGGVISVYKSAAATLKDRIKSKDKEKDKDKEKEKEGGVRVENNSKGDRDRDTRGSVIYYTGNTGTGTGTGTGTQPGTRQEGLYIRYLRVGDIQVDVSLSGFPLNVENYRAVVEPFFCRGTVLLNWQRLIYSFERHASRSLIRNTASSSLTRLSNFFSFSNVPRPDVVTNAGTQIVGVIKRSTGTGGHQIPVITRSNVDDEEKKKIAQLLGGLP